MSGSGVPLIWRTSANPSFTKQFELSVEDHMAVRYARTEPLPFGRFAAFVTLCTLFAGLIIAFGWWKDGDRWLAAGIVAGAAAAGPALAWPLYGFFRQLFKGFWKGFLETRGAISTPFELTVDGRGLSILVRGQSWFCPWDSLGSVEEDADRFYFWTSTWQAHVLPKREFDQAELGEFGKALEGWLGHPPVSPPRRVGAASV